MFLCLAISLPSYESLFGCIPGITAMSLVRRSVHLFEVKNASSVCVWLGSRVKQPECLLERGIHLCMGIECYKIKKKTTET